MSLFTGNVPRCVFMNGMNNKVHTKPETFDAKSCECMISMHYEERFCEQS